MGNIHSMSEATVYRGPKLLFQIQIRKFFFRWFIRGEDDFPGLIFFIVIKFVIIRKHNYLPLLFFDIQGPHRKKRKTVNFPKKYDILFDLKQIIITNKFVKYLLRNIYGNPVYHMIIFLACELCKIFCTAVLQLQDRSTYYGTVLKWILCEVLWSWIFSFVASQFLWVIEEFYYNEAYSYWRI